MNKTPIRFAPLAAAALLALAAASHADTLATWSLNGTAAGTTTLTNVLSVGEITAKSVKLNSPPVSGKGMGASGWPTSASPNTNYYYQFTVTASDDFYLNLGELAMNFRSTKEGPAKAAVRWSLDGRTWTTNAIFDDIPQDGNDKGHPYPADFTGVTVGTNETLTVQILAWNAKTAGGTFRIGNGSKMTLAGTAIGTELPPTIVFPNEAETVSLSNTLTVAIGVLPNGTITDWSFTPAPAGTCSLIETNFTFTPLAADVGKTFTLTVYAANKHGDSEASLPVTVTEYVPADAWMTGFETGNDPKNPSSPTNWVIDGRTWSIQQLSFSDKADLPKVGARACVFGSYNPAFMVSTAKMLDATNGFGTVSFLYGEYPGESEPCQPIIVEIATDLAAGDWMEIGRVNPAGVSTPEKASFDVSVSEPVYLRIRTEYVNKSGRVCIDQLTVLPYVAPVRNDFETYLLKYNVTPGDPGCASQNFWAEGENDQSYLTDDFDEDGWSNWAEFQATTPTNAYNPYDKTSHPPK